ncbi:MAG: ABC transporter substrate-binding protein [Anaerolineales bacterium]
MQKRVVIFMLVVALAVAVPFVAANQAPADEAMPMAQTAPEPFSWLTECEEDLSGQEITFYHFGDLSGPYAFITQPLIAGLGDAAQLLNDNGGLCGATVGQEFRDTGGNTDQTQAFWDEFSALDGAYAIFLYASADAELLRNQAADAEIPLLVAAGSELAFYGEDGQSPGYAYGIIPLYTDQLGAFCDYVSANWDEMGIEGDPVIGHLSWEGAFGRSSDTEGARAYCEAAGVGYAGAEYFLPGTPDISTQMQGLVDEGANIIYTTSLASGPAQVAGTASALGLNDSVILAGSNWALDTSVIGLGGEATDGMMGSLPFLWWDEVQEPGVQIVLNYWAQNRLAEDPEAAVQVRNIAYITSFGAVDLWAEAMIRSINEVGFENMSGAALQETMTNLDYDAFLGMIRADFTDGARATQETRIASIQFIEGDEGVTPSVVPVDDEVFGDWFIAPDLKLGGEDVPE